MTAGSRRVRTLLGALAALCLALTAALACSAAAEAEEFGVVPGSFQVTQSTTQAGAHPDVTIRFEYTSRLEMHPLLDPNDPSTQPMPRPLETPRNIAVDLPPGLIGDPSAADRCTAVQFASSSCPPTSQVGLATVDVFLFPIAWPVPVYNLVPSKGVPAELGFYALTVPVHVLVSVRDEDHGLRTTIADIPSQGPLWRSELTLWGNPSDPAHWDVPAPYVKPRGFMTNAATCDGPSRVRLSTESYESPGRFTYAETELPALTGCERQRFAGSGSARPATPQAGSPSGYTIELDVPQRQAPDGLATPPVKDVVVRLPLGTVVSPSTSDGLRTCADAVMKVESSELPDCPEASRIGTVRIDTPLLARAMTGGVFLTEQRPDRLLRMVLVAEEAGVRLKLPGAVDLDPATGQITATFANNPQLQFDHLTVTLKGGPRAPLANPRECGPATTTTTLVPWGGGQPVVSEDTFAITCAGAPSGFTPSFSAGAASTRAGAASAFTLAFGRQDRDELLSGIDVRMPAGALPRLASTPLCAEALAATGGCGEASRIGTVVTDAGPGALPFRLPGRVYVTGPYEGAPYGLSIVVPALAGPYDLGTVVVRAKVDVDLHTAALRIVSDPLPTILQGIPLQLRGVRVEIDKPGFMLNPTSCARRNVTAAVSSTAGTVADVRASHQVAGCKALRYTPKLTVQVGGRGRLAAHKPTALVATLTQPAGQAASRSVRLALPKVVNARMEIVRRACTQAAYDAGSCGAAARIGSAVAVTPLLPNPLRGAAYFVRNPARRLPDVVVQLRGDVAFDLVGKVLITRDLRLTTTFDTIPDVPLSRFTLTLPAGNGPVGASAGLCTRAARLARAQQTLRAQNGKVIARAARLRIAGCKKK